MIIFIVIIMSLLEFLKDNDVKNDDVKEDHTNEQKKTERINVKSKGMKVKKIEPKEIEPEEIKPNNVEPKKSNHNIKTINIKRKPSAMWYILHVPLGFASGPLCHAMWESKNEKEAIKHLHHGVMVNAGMLVAVGVSMILSFA